MDAVRRRGVEVLDRPVFRRTLFESEREGEDLFSQSDRLYFDPLRKTPVAKMDLEEYYGRDLDWIEDNYLEEEGVECARANWLEEKGQEQLSRQTKTPRPQPTPLQSHPSPRRDDWKSFKSQKTQPEQPEHTPDKH